MVLGKITQRCVGKPIVFKFRPFISKRIDQQVSGIEWQRPLKMRYPLKSGAYPSGKWAMSPKMLSLFFFMAFPLRSTRCLDKLWSWRRKAARLKTDSWRQCLPFQQFSHKMWHDYCSMVLLFPFSLLFWVPFALLGRALVLAREGNDDSWQAWAIMIMLFQHLWRVFQRRRLLFSSFYPMVLVFLSGCPNISTGYCVRLLRGWCHQPCLLILLPLFCWADLLTVSADQPSWDAIGFLRYDEYTLTTVPLLKRCNLILPLPSSFSPQALNTSSLYPLSCSFLPLEYLKIGLVDPWIWVEISTLLDSAESK